MALKKRWIWALLLAVALAGAALSRLWQRGSAWEEGGLVTPGHPATYTLLAVLAAAAVGFFLLGRWTAGARRFESYLDAFSLPCRGLLAVYVLAGALMVAGGVLGLMELTRQGAAPRQRAAGLALLPGGIDAVVVGWINNLALLFGGMGAALVGWVNSRREEAKGRFSWPLLLPGYAGCLWLIAIYQDRATEPNVLGYVFVLLGALCAVSCCYTQAAFSFEKPMPTLTVWLGGMALTALGVELVDALLTGDAAQGLVSLGYMLYLAGQSWCLLTRADRPADLARWTPPEDGTGQREETQEEVERHEQ